jgi:tetratricopeptide (TPR) repeat protein
MNKTLQIVVALLEQEKTENARQKFLEIEPEQTLDYWMVKGKLEQKFQNWGEAINAFGKVLEIDSENLEAQNNLHIIQNILNFWNPEMFNP